MREVIESQYHANGINLTVFEWPAEGPKVFFARATGFHARCWDGVIERLPGLRVLGKRLAFSGLLSRGDETISFLAEAVEPDKEQILQPAKFAMAAYLAVVERSVR
mgnify:CR=1 FL=1